LGGEGLAISEEGRRLGLDAEDNVYLAGTITGTVDFDFSDGVSERTPHPNGSAFLASYTAGGNYRFAKVWDTPGQGLGLTTEADGTTHVTGSFSGTITFDDDDETSTFSAGGGTDVFVAAFEPSGNYRAGSAFAFGGNGLNVGRGIAVDAAGNVVLTGHFTNTTDFDLGDGVDERTSAGQQDLFMALYPAGSVGTATEDAPAESPETYVLAQNYPNPFNPQTTIPFAVPEAGPVRLDIVDLLGRRVATLVEGTRPAGRYTVVWDAGATPSGVYLYRLQAGRHVEMKKMTLLR
jgi:hypothetical protein